MTRRRRAPRWPCRCRHATPSTPRARRRADIRNGTTHAAPRPGSERSRATPVATPRLITHDHKNLEEQNQEDYEYLGCVANTQKEQDNRQEHDLGDRVQDVNHGRYKPIQARALAQRQPRRDGQQHGKGNAQRPPAIRLPGNGGPAPAAAQRSAPQTPQSGLARCRAHHQASSCQTTRISAMRPSRSRRRIAPLISLRLVPALGAASTHFSQ